jgi:hypothetical protein
MGSMRWLLVVLVAGCAESTPGRKDPDTHDLSLPTAAVDLGAADDLASPAMVSDGGRDLGRDLGHDLASPPDQAAAPPAFYGDGGQCGPKVNEVQTSVSGGTGSGYYEFVELYNPCPDFYLDGWSVVYRSASNTSAANGNDSTTLYSFGHVLFASAHYLVLGGQTFPGPADAPLSGPGIADDGSVGIRDPQSRLVDSVAFGAVDPANAFIENTAATKAPRVGAPGMSIQRRPDGWDTNDNAADFTAASPTPGAAN